MRAFTAPLTWKRWVLYLVTSFLLYLILVIGAFTPQTEDQIRERSSLLREILESIDGPDDIFLNNFYIALLMCVPLIGTVSGIFILFNTGQVLAAAALSTGIDIGFAAILPLWTIFGVLEFLGYGVATFEGVILFFSLIKKKFRNELLNLPLALLLIFILLLLAALIEFWLITS
ncbi:MAG: hypothetical protein NZ920_03380 [Aigarchaeota archaeon]|nr:hypothetical protein [Aigarchaeota archaeon]MDW8092339.1 hypothetical protein [Nitrososphaerota archaeon]